MQSSANIGIAKWALQHMFLTSSEKQIIFLKTGNTGNDVKVVATKDFAVNKFMLVGLTNSVTVSKVNDTSKAEAYDLGIRFAADDKTYKLAAARSPGVWEPLKTHDIAVSSKEIKAIGFWEVKKFTKDGAATAGLVPNCELTARDIAIKIGTTSTNVKVPIIVNTVPIKCGDAIVCVTSPHVEVDEEAPEPPRKKSKGGRGKGKASK